MAVSNISGASGASGAIPTAGEMADFSKAIHGADTKDLIKARDQPGMEPWQKDAIDKELQNRAAKSDQAQGAGGSGGGGSDPDEIAKLFKKLTDGTISQEELQKLAGMLGVKAEDLDPMKGKGDAGGGNSGGSDITGG